MVSARKENFQLFEPLSKHTSPTRVVEGGPWLEPRGITGDQTFNSIHTNSSKNNFVFKLHTFCRPTSQALQVRHKSRPKFWAILMKRNFKASWMRQIFFPCVKIPWLGLVSSLMVEEPSSYGFSTKRKFSAVEPLSKHTSTFPSAASCQTCLVI